MLFMVTFPLYLESRGLAAATINQRLAAHRRLAYEAADSGLLSPKLAAGIRRAKGVKQLGQRSGKWLNLEQCRSLLVKSDGGSLRNNRDLAMIANSVGLWLASSRIGIPENGGLQIRQGHWAIVDLVVKGGHVRTVPGVWNSITLLPTTSAELAPNYAIQLGGQLEQIQLLPGDYSVLTLERYLGCKQNFEQPVNDRLGPLIAFKEMETS